MAGIFLRFICKHAFDIITNTEHKFARINIINVLSVLAVR